MMGNTDCYWVKFDQYNIPLYFLKKCFLEHSGPMIQSFFLKVKSEHFKLHIVFNLD